jgi:hypothetical protein
MNSAARGVAYGDPAANPHFDESVHNPGAGGIGPYSGFTESELVWWLNWFGE